MRFTSRLKTIALAGFAAAALAFGAAAVQAQVPDAYPADYQKIIDASKSENQLLIYSNMADYNWEPVIKAFNARYPWIKVETLDLGSSEVFTRYNVEAGSNARTADLLAVGAVEAWIRLSEAGGVMPYKSEETARLPAFAQPLPSVYAISTDPMVIVYNKLAVPEDKWPKSMADIAKLAKESPDDYRKALTTNSADYPFGQPIHWTWLKAKGDAGWEMQKTYGPLAVQEESSGNMLKKISSGEYKIGYFVSSIAVFPKVGGARDKLIGWAFPADGTPMMLRSAAIPAKSTNVNSAKLMLDFVLSLEGQTASGKGGLTPYRDGIDQKDVAYQTFQSIKQVVGKDNMLIVDYSQEFVADIPNFMKRWKESIGQ